MASKNPELNVPETEEQDLKKTAKAKTNENAELEAARKEIEALKKQLSAQQPIRKSGETDYARVHRIEMETIAENVDPWTVEIEVLAPHKNPTEDPWYWININSRSVQIPANDQYHKMKLPFACVLVDTILAEWRGADYKDSLQVYDPVTNPHKEEYIRSGT